MALNVIGPNNLSPLVLAPQDTLGQEILCKHVDLVPKRERQVCSGGGLLRPVARKLLARTGRANKSKSQPLRPLGNIGKAINSGRWGRAFATAGVGLPLLPGPPPYQITEQDVGRMFGWHQSVCKECRASYARMMEDILQLPTARRLIGEIITACYNHRQGGTNPQRVEFIQNGSDSGHYARDGDTCSINIKWDNGCHIGGDGIMLVRAKGGGLSFVGVQTPPSLDLAHELSHFLYALHTPAGGGGNLSARTQNRAQATYNSILNGVIHLPPTTAVETAFEDLWNGGNFVEVVNILPSRNILVTTGVPMGAGTPAGVMFDYSDGIMIWEALNPANNFPNTERPKFFNLDTNGAIAVNHGGLTVNSFVRFSHGSARRFTEVYGGLSSVGQIQFGAFVQNLLRKITINGHPGTVADLPGL